MRGETKGVDFEKFHAGVVSTLNDIISAHPGQTVAVTCHGGVINAWTAHVLGMEARMFFNPNYTSISRYMAASSGERSIITITNIPTYGVWDRIGVNSIQCCLAWAFSMKA